MEQYTIKNIIKDKLKSRIIKDSYIESRKYHPSVEDSYKNGPKCSLAIKCYICGKYYRHTEIKHHCKYCRKDNHIPI